MLEPSLGNLLKGSKLRFNGFALALLFTCILLFQPQFAESCSLPQISKFSLNLQTGVVGRLHARLTDEDFKREYLAHNKSPTRGFGQFFSRDEWDKFPGPVSAKVRPFFYSIPHFRSDFPDGNFDMTITVQYFEAGEFANSYTSPAFHNDAKTRGKNFYIFVLSPGDEVIAPTEFYIGPHFAALDALALGEEVLLPASFRSFTHQVQNGQLIRSSTLAAHRRTPAQKAGWRYFIRAPFNCECD